MTFWDWRKFDISSKWQLTFGMKLKTVSNECESHCEEENNLEWSEIDKSICVWLELILLPFLLFINIYHIAGVSRRVWKKYLNLYRQKDLNREREKSIVSRFSMKFNLHKSFDWILTVEMLVVVWHSDEIRVQLKNKLEFND